MNIYVAAPWAHREQAKTAADAFVAAGHTIAEEWWNHRDVGVYPHSAEGEALAELQRQGIDDLTSLYQADVMVVLQLAISEGKAFEQGVAYNLDKPIIVISPNGDRGNLFHYLPRYRFSTSIEGAIKLLERRKERG